MNGRAASAMACPVNGTTLVMSERQGIEIDYCPSCRGVWLDRGELDKIVERSAADLAPASAGTQPDRSSPWPPDRRSEHDDHRGYGQRKRRKSFLEDLFD